MAKKRRNNNLQSRWVGNCDTLSEIFPHASSWWADEENFRELRLKARDDGTTLAIAKGYAADGSPIVCFGSGYGLVGALMSVDAAMQGGNWRKDKPYEP